MRTCATAWLILAATLISVSPATAAVPRLINFQGSLTDANGHPLDGEHVVTFRIYYVLQGGTPKWEETQVVSAYEGLFHTLLGGTSALPDTLFEHEDLWMGLLIDSDPEIVPRMQLATVPWAFRAAVAESALVAGVPDDGDWVQAGDDVYRLSGNVGIGTGEPAVALDIDKFGTQLRLGGDNTYGARMGISTYYSGSQGVITQFDLTPPTDDTEAMVRFFRATDTTGPKAVILHPGDGSSLIDTQLGVNGMNTFFASGNVGIGTKYPSDKLEVAGIVHSTTGGFKFPDGTLQTTAGLTNDGDWSVSGNNMYSAVSGNVGIGASTPAAKLEISAGGGGAIGLLLGNRDRLRFKNYSGGAGGEMFVGEEGNDNLFIDKEGDGNIALRTQNGTVLGIWVRENGKVGIGTELPSCKLQVGTSGDGSFALANDWRFFSSAQYKSNIQALEMSDYEDVLAKIRDTELFSFQYDWDEGGVQHIGALAENSPEEILSPDGKAVSLADYAGFLLAAIKAQQLEINALRNELEGLKADLME